ncbi:unnamed protein product [Brachionus calyciflorus]|uniref:Uncharacterized protein n=1 Tax=Brachionus calyciflorus TaxID=104777 RepID=A0A813LY80_9BILA|nr:unnamed protein product [Brachionus calyciflorus]
MEPNAPNNKPLFSFPNRFEFPSNRLNPVLLYDQTYLNELKSSNLVANDDSSFLALFDNELEREYFQKRSFNNFSNLKSSSDIHLPKLDGINKNTFKNSPRNINTKNNLKLKENFSNDDLNQLYTNEARFTPIKAVNPLKNPSVHEYLYSLAEKKDSEGYFEKYKEIKQNRNKELPKASETLKEYKRFKENAGFGFNFLDPTRSKELTEVKIEKVNKRNHYANYVKERNLAILNRRNTYNPEAYINMDALPYLQYRRFIYEDKKN